jgi:photosystem II stability/assembly factor-like uncharacterized protein
MKVDKLRAGIEVALILLLLVFGLNAAKAQVMSGRETQPKESPPFSNERKYQLDYFDYFYAVASGGGSTLWIVGNSGRIIHSLDGGKSWLIQRSPTAENLNSVSFIDSRSGWACGNGGTVVHTSDGGATWELQNTGTKHPIFKIQFLTREIGYACGYFGMFLRTADGGRTWENKSIGEDVTLRGMSFPSEKTGFIVGEFGSMLKTVDSGSTFTRLKSPVDTTLFAVYFSDANSGYASGIDGSVASTVDGGRTWRKEDSGTKDHLIGICSNGRIAVAVGLRGAVRAKVIGGKWAAVDAKTLNWISGIQLGKDRNGLAVGAHGTILRLEEILPKGKVE